ncbi:hypothetical protein [Streptosporangium subroseum]|nr:hypothetical protein OHB15_46755 [Streptosporangium subroseum]
MGANGPYGLAPSWMDMNGVLVCDLRGEPAGVRFLKHHDAVPVRWA